MTIADSHAQSSLDAANAQLERPFNRWLRKQQEAGGHALEAMAACVLMEELRCTTALAETLVPSYFTRAQRFRLRAALFEAKNAIDPEAAIEFAAGTRADATKPFGIWLAEQAKLRAGAGPEGAQKLAIDAAAARLVYETFRCAQAIAKDRPDLSEKLSIDDVFEIYDALLEHQERMQGGGGSEPGPDDAAV